MRTRWMSATRLSSFAAVALIVLSALAHRAGAQEPITLSFIDEHVVVQATGPTQVTFDYNLKVTPDDTWVECSPESGSIFAVGATEVTCVAGEGEQAVSASFYVFVTTGDETDIAIADVTVNPLPADVGGVVAYNITLHNLANATARRFIVSTTLPPELTFLDVSDQRCNTTQLPHITCTFLNLDAGIPRAFTLRGLIKADTTGAFQYTWNLSLDDGQADLRTDNNQFTVNTVTQPSRLSNRIYLPEIVRP